MYPHKLWKQEGQWSEESAHKTHKGAPKRSLVENERSTVKARATSAVQLGSVEKASGYSMPIRCHAHHRASCPCACRRVLQFSFPMSRVCRGCRYSGNGERKGSGERLGALCFRYT